MLINYLLITLIGFLVGIVLMLLLRKFALRYKVLSPQGIPLIGGMGMGLSFIFTCLFISFLYGNLYLETKGIVFASAIMLIFGLIDDYRELSILTKFLVQIIATSFLVLFGIKTQIVNIGNLANLIITFIWVLAITNAFNHLDIIDGLASGTAIIVSSAFFIISFLNGDSKTAILSLALVGAVLSFFLYNFPPAKIYLGNSGSHFLGFSLAAIALAISYAPLERKVALLSPIFILGLPIFDTLFLIFIRITKGRLPFQKSNDHIALRLLKSGYSKKASLLFMLLLCLFFSFCGVLLSQASNPFGIGIITLVIFAGLIITFKISKIPIDG